MDEALKKTNQDWSGLPQGILEIILKELPLNDYLSFSNVCKSWRSIAAEACLRKPSLGFPWLLMSGESLSKSRTCFSVLENKIRCMEMPKSHGNYFWGSFQDWLIMVKPVCARTLLRISLRNLFSGAEVVLRYSKNSFYKLVFSGIPGEQTCMYMLFSCYSAQFSLWSPGASDWRDCRIERGDHFIQEVITYNGCFYVLTGEFNIRVIDVGYASSIFKRAGSSAVVKTQYYEVEKTFEAPRDYRRVLVYLVELCGEVVVVFRFLRTILGDTEKFELYRLDIDRMAWVKLDRLGDQVLFLSRSCSRSFSFKELGNDTANCIYFTNETHLAWDVNEWTELLSYSLKGSTVDDWGIFKIDSDGSKGFSYPSKPDNWPPMWITAPLWWYFHKTRRSAEFFI